MGKHKKYIVLAAVGATALLLYSKASSLLNFVRVLSISPKLDGGLEKINFRNGSLNIPLAVDFGNRSDQEISIGITSLILFYNGKQIGEIRPTYNSVLVKKYSTSTLSNLIVQIPLTKLLITVGSVINTIISTQDFSKLMSSISLDITCVLNNSIVFNMVKKIGETQNVNLDNGAALGLVSYGERKIHPLREVEMYLPARTNLHYSDLIVRSDISPEETPAVMHRIVRQYISDTKTLSRYLKKDNLKETIQSVFDFVFNYIKYVPDSREAEQLRRPLRTIYDQKGDCDCYAILIGSILTNLNIPFKFRIAAYNGKPNYQHVYVIIPTSKGYYVCDPVLDNCFEEKKPSKFLDF